MELERGRKGQEEGPAEELRTVVRTSLVHGGMVHSLGLLAGRYAKRWVGDETWRKGKGQAMKHEGLWSWWGSGLDQVDSGEPSKDLRLGREELDIERTCNKPGEGWSWPMLSRGNENKVQNQETPWERKKWYFWPWGEGEFKDFPQYVLISNLDNSWGGRMVGWLLTQAPESEGLCLFPR